MEDYTVSLQSHMEMLCQTIGARPTGSTNNKVAVDYVAEVLQSYGFQIQKQELDCMDWQNLGASLYIDGNTVPVKSSEYSLPCDIEAEYICIDTVDALKKANLSGKIAVLYGNLCNEPLMPKNFKFYNPDEHKEIIALLEEKAPQAIITAIQNDEHIIQDGDFHIPCAVVHENNLDTFRNGRKAKLTINAKRVSSKAHNVIATYGTGSYKVCFSAHIDTKPATSGALDNASGVSVLLALAEFISGNEYPFEIEIALLNGEDYYSTPGEIAYMGLLTSEYSMAINVDGVGLKDSATSVSFYECSEQLEDKIMERVGRRSGFERIEQWYMGDHMMFATFGIPTIAVTASNIFGLHGTLIHSPEDNMENIDMAVLNKVVQFLRDCIE